MPDFPGEGGRDLLNDEPVDPPKKSEELVEEAVKKAPRAELVPPPPTSAHKPLRVKDERRADIESIARDFREGVAALQQALRPGGRSAANPELRAQAMERIRELSASTKERMRTVVEKEMQTITRVSEKIPIPNRHVPTMIEDFKRRAEAAVAEKIPQSLAAVMKAEHEVRSTQQSRVPRASVAMRPGRGSPVESLMKVAKSIRAGRLPFVPKETKKEAQKLVDAVVGRDRGRRMAELDAETLKLMEQHNLIPAAVQGSLEAERSPDGEHDRISERLEVVLREISRSPGRSTAIPISEHDALGLESKIPRFRDEGAVYGGPAIVDAGETREDVGGMSVIYREGSSHVQSPEAPARKESVAKTVAKRAPPTATPPPQAEPHRAPPADSEAMNRTHGGLGTGKGGGTVGASGGPVRIEGKLEIDGLREWIAKVTGTMNDV